MKYTIPSLVVALGLCAGASLLAADAPAPAPKPAPAAMTRPAPPPITLHVGDPAPPLKYKEWIKGTETPTLEKGHIYVVEFWATWCGWCKFSMRHLSQMAKEYDGKVTFISMDVWEHPKKGEPYPYGKVGSFVQHAGDVMSYNVAADTEDGFMTKAWLAASGQQGIPACVVVGADGNVAWIGHPALGLEQALKLAVAGKLDKAAAERVTKQGQSQASEVQGILQVMNEALKDPTQAKTAIYCADTVMKMNTLWNFLAVPGKYMALYSQDPAAAKAYAEAAIADKTNGPTILMALAQKLSAKDNPHPDYALAKEAMDAAMANSDPTDEELYPARASIAFKNGDATQAVTLQKIIVRNATDNLNDMSPDAPARMKEYYRKNLESAQETLKEYQGTETAQASNA